MTPVFASPSRIAERCGVTKPCVTNWVTRDNDMPAPDAWVAYSAAQSAPLWANDGQAVVEWALKRLEARAAVSEQKARAEKSKAARARRRVNQVS